MNDDVKKLVSDWIDNNLTPRSHYNRLHPTGVLKSMYRTNKGESNPEVGFEDFNEVMEQKGFLCEQPNKLNRLWKVKIKKPRY